MEVENDDGKFDTCLRVCLTEKSAYWDEERNGQFYSRISADDLKKLCQLSKYDKALTIFFTVQDENNTVDIPLKAEEVEQILSKNDFLTRITNIYKTRQGKANILLDVILAGFFLFLYISLVVYPRYQEKKEIQQLEERRLKAWEWGFKEITFYDGYGRKVHFTGDSSEYTPMVHEGDDTYSKKINRITDKSWEYDSYGKLVYEKEEFDETSENYKNFRHIDDTVTKEIKSAIKYKYDSKGNLASVIYNDGSKVKFTCDENGNVLYSESTTGEKIWNTYNEEGKIISTINERGDKTTYEYDEKGRLSKINYPDETYEEYDYWNNSGKLYRNNVVCKEREKEYVLYYTYNDDGRLEKIEKLFNRRKETRTYEYDNEGRLIYEVMRNRYYFREEKGRPNGKIEEEAWYMYDLYPDGKVKKVIKYYL